MNTSLFQFSLHSSVAYSLGWTLLHALWQGFALVLPAALLMYVFRRRSSQLRYTIGVGALLAQVTISIVTFAWYYQPVFRTVHSSTKNLMTAAVSIPALWPLASRSLPWNLQMQRFLEIHLTEIVVCWLIGVAVFLVRLAGGWLYVQRLKTTAVQPADAFWQSMQTRLSTRLAMRQSVRILESAQVLVPMVVGALKPVILLPIGLITGLSVQEAEAILAHELAHVKRFDYAVNLLQSVIEVVYFFHPALWWLSARVREERENCCDDLAVLACGDARSLAQALARVEEFSQTPVLAMALASQKKLLLNRVRRMLGVSARPVVSNGHLLILTLATALLATASVYAMQQAQPKPKPRVPQPPSTRQHKTPNGTEFGMTNNRKVDYVIWKGQKLPPKQVAGLQRQLDAVMAGQLSLDTVAKPDRDILLTIIETGQSFNEGVKGLAHIDYNNMVASALTTIPLSPDGTVDGLAKVDYNAIIQDAFSSVSNSPSVADSIIEPDIRDIIRRQDSLVTLRELNAGKVASLNAQVQTQQFAVEAVERKIERLERQKSVLEQQRFSETSAQQLTILKSGTTRTDSGRVALTRQLEAGELAIQKTENSIETLNQQLVNMQSELEKVERPLRATEADLRKLRYSGYYPTTTAITSENGGRGRNAGTAKVTGIRGSGMLEPPEIPERPGINIKGSAVRLPRIPWIPRTPKSLRGATIPKPARPAPALRPVPALAPELKPAVAPKPPTGERQGLVAPTVNLLSLLRLGRTC